MKVLLKARTTKGFLMVYDDRVAIELKFLGSYKANTIMKEQLTGVEIKVVMAAVFMSPGAATVKVFGTGDQKLEAPFVKVAEAKKAEALILNLMKKKSGGSSDADELEKLSQLKDKGILTQEEFDQKKKQILGL
jgi:hypothetical protein